MSDQVVSRSERDIAKGSQSFSAAARLFDRSTRDDAVMLYAWCRHCDDVIDGQTLGMAQEADFRDGQMMRLVRIREQTLLALRGEATDAYIFEALRRVVERHDIPHRYPLDLIRGFEMDVEQRRYETVEDTLEYCYHVAGVVGVMMAMIMGVRDETILDRATDLGLAFQLTNIARDVIDDARAGRVYLPAETLKRHGIEEIEPENRAQWPGIHAAALELLRIADDYYASAAIGVAALPVRSAWAIAAAARIYRSIGIKLRHGGPTAWERRVSTGRVEKLALLSRALGDVIATRRSIETTPRIGLWQRPT
jgi:phytoene synthase